MIETTDEKIPEIFGMPLYPNKEQRVKNRRKTSRAWAIFAAVGFQFGFIWLAFMYITYGLYKYLNTMSGFILLFAILLPQVVSIYLFKVLREDPYKPYKVYLVSWLILPLIGILLKLYSF